MNKTQKNYAAAYALWETAVLAECAECAPLYEIEDEDERDAAIEAVSARYNISELFDLKREAEEAMLAWAFNKVKRSKHCVGKFAEAHEICYQSRNNPIVRRKLVDLAFRLA